MELELKPKSEVEILRERVAELELQMDKLKERIEQNDVDSMEDAWFQECECCHIKFPQNEICLYFGLRTCKECLHTLNITTKPKK